MTLLTDLQSRLDDMTRAEHNALVALHELLAEVKQKPRSLKYDPVQFIEDIEYTMQSIWGFSRDRDFHIHWVDLKGCTCPKDDNRSAAFGAPFRYVADDCPHHTREVPF